MTMYSYKTQVTASHIDKRGLQTPVSVLSMMQDCSQLWLDSEPKMKKYLEDNAITMMIASRQVDFLQRATYATTQIVKTNVYDCNGFMGYRNTALYGEDGTVYAKSWSVGIFVSLETDKPVRLPKTVTDEISYDEKLPMEYLSKRIDLLDTEPRQYPSIVAQRSDIDINQHVNNTQYIRMACEYPPEGVTYSRLRVEYKQAAKQGDILFPHVYEGNAGTVLVALRNEEASPYALVEFSRPQAT